MNLVTNEILLKILGLMMEPPYLDVLLDKIMYNNTEIEKN